MRRLNDKFEQVLRFLMLVHPEFALHEISDDGMHRGEGAEALPDVPNVQVHAEFALHEISDDGMHRGEGAEALPDVPNVQENVFEVHPHSPEQHPRIFPLNSAEELEEWNRELEMNEEDIVALANSIEIESGSSLNWTVNNILLKFMTYEVLTKYTWKGMSTANHELKDPNFNKQCQTAINSIIVEMKQIESEENYLEKTLEKGKRKRRALDFIGKINKFISGTLDHDDEEYHDEQIKSLFENEKHIQHNAEKQTTIIKQLFKVSNSTMLNTEQNLNMVKEQIENLKDILVKEDEKLTSTDTVNRNNELNQFDDP
jgi:Domain of unknown function (DUF4806)